MAIRGPDGLRGHVVYDGPSLIDGKPIVALLSNLWRPSENAGTGDLTQTWILRKDRPPTEARKDGSDVSICGDCIHREWGTCYVVLHRAPNQVWRGWKEGLYSYDPVPDVPRMRTRGMRLAAYGETTAVPFEVWEPLVERVSFHLNYTHRWAECDQRFRRIAMASTDTVTETLLARKMGWRTFRTRLPGEPLLPFEFDCPKSELSGHRLTCEECKACWGADDVLTRASASIEVHGAQNLVAKYINKRAEERQMEMQL